MTSEERIKRQKELVETMGRMYDRKGFQPISGRIVALLTVMDKELFTFDEIVEELQISKGSASNALRMLEMSNIIEYITLPGDRKKHFRIRKHDKFSLIDEHKEKLNISLSFLKETLDLKADKNSGNAQFIRSMIDMLGYFLEKFEELKIEYLQKNN
ncbi:MAG: hypothetical protein JXB34_14470 [Bacteroidales bacterium]|nr:hypothetical protein [Bacteroidales bacterium]